MSVTKNSKNKQISLNLKKRKLKEIGMTEDDLLDMKITKIRKVF